MFVIFLTENFKFLSRFTYSNGPIERAGKVWLGFPGPQVTWIYLLLAHIELTQSIFFLYLIFSSVFNSCCQERMIMKAFVDFKDEKDYSRFPFHTELKT